LKEEIAQIASPRGGPFLHQEVGAEAEGTGQWLFLATDENEVGKL
jgi:hypothetical protein